MKAIILFLLFLPSLAFAFDCDKENDSHLLIHETDSLLSFDFTQNGPAQIQSTSNGFLDTLRIIVCTPQDKKLLLGKFAFPDTVLTCFATAQTTFQIRLSQLYDAGFHISKIEASGTKVLYYIEK